MVSILGTRGNAVKADDAPYVRCLYNSGYFRPIEREAMTTSIQESLPDLDGRFGPYGGKFVPETLMQALAELEQAYRAAKQDPSFQDELQGCRNCTPGGQRRFTTLRISPMSWAARKSTSSARTWPTPARTRSTTRSDRDC